MYHNSVFLVYTFKTLPEKIGMTRIVYKIFETLKPKPQNWYRYQAGLGFGPGFDGFDCSFTTDTAWTCTF